jgi:hypothetical protein
VRRRGGEGRECEAGGMERTIGTYYYFFFILLTLYHISPPLPFSLWMQIPLGDVRASDLKQVKRVTSAVEGIEKIVCELKEEELAERLKQERMRREEEEQKRRQQEERMRRNREERSELLECSQGAAPGSAGGNRNKSGRIG